MHWLYCAKMVASGDQDEYYTYDTLYQLLELQRGTLKTDRTGFSGTPAREKDFTLDPTGNWEISVIPSMSFFELFWAIQVSLALTFPLMHQMVLMLDGHIIMVYINS